MSKLLVIVGVTGNQGSSVAEAFLQDPTWKIRGTSRDPSKVSSKALAAKGLEMVPGDIDDVESLKKAFEGANMIFGNTAFDMTPIIQPTVAILAKLRPNQTTNEYAYDIEVQQGKNIVDAVATVGDSLQLFVWSSLSDATKWSGGKYTNVYHFDSKVAVVKYVHERYPELASKMSLLQLGLFINNWKWGQAAVPWEKRPDGSMVLRIPGSGDQLVPFIVPSDAGAFVAALSKLPPGKNAIAYGSLMTWADLVKLWSKVTGHPATFVQGTVAEHDKLAPGGYGLEIAEMYAYMQEFGYWGGGDKSVTFAKDLDVKTTSMEEYIRNEDWSELLNRPVPES